MKKLASLVLSCIFAFTLVFFPSCKTGSSLTGWFKYSVLLSTGLTKMPKPDFEYKGSDMIRRYVKGVIEREEFERYVDEVFEWVTEKYACVGSGGYEIDTFFGGAGTYKFVEREKKLEEFGGFSEGGSGYYTFVFFKDPPVEGDFTTDVISLYYSPELRQWSEGKDDYQYNFTIELKNGGMKDKYVYTDKEYFDLHFSNVVENAEQSAEYPQIEILRDYQAYCDYLSDNSQSTPWKEYSFRGKICVVLTFKKEKPCSYFYLKSVRKRNEKWVFEIGENPNGTSDSRTGDFKLGILLDDYVELFSADDVVFEYTNA